MMVKIKEVSQSKKKYLQLLSVYWFVLPILFISYLFLKANIEKQGIQHLLTSDPLLAIMLLLSLITPFSSLFLLKTIDENNKVPTTVIQFLKFALIQQLVVGNLLGVGLCFLSLKENNLSQKSEKSEKSGLIIVIVFETIFTLIAIFALTMLMKNR